MNQSITISVVADPNKTDGERECAPATTIHQLLSAGRLPNFVQAVMKPNTGGLGNCHEIALSLMADLKVANNTAGWQWATGDTIHFDSGGRRKHSWLEVDGWVIDYLDGRLFFAERWWYRRLNKCRNVKLRDAKATGRWLSSHS